MRLDVWIEGHGAPVGVLTRNSDKSLHFAYCTNVPPTVALSLSLPLADREFNDARCRGYFANLLFEGAERDRIFASRQLDDDDVGGMLSHLGADCPGAISIVMQGQGPGKMPGRFPEHYEAIKDVRLLDIVRSLHHVRHLPPQERNPSPVAGVQGKIALLALQGRYYLPKPGSGAPTTHILKVSPIGDPDVTVREVALLEVARHAGIEAAGSTALVFDEGATPINAILSTRFDRKVEPHDDGSFLIRRVHAEDFCQALGLAPSLKYERANPDGERRFSAAAMTRIADHAPAPVKFAKTFARQVIFNLLVGNSDNHGKNGSIIHTSAGVELAPLYDVVPVFMDNQVTQELAFSHGGAVFARDVDQAALTQLCVALGLGRGRGFLERTIRETAKMARDIMTATTKDCPGDLAEALRSQIGTVEAALGLDIKP
ncbi:HipA domain-containing protein [Falsirhodobacter xinxiangensis]|uniref:HipA domain-containing protein n=1 Tax=Falsirhodobacter xinxiangensis TaxID=2530049 RepID=UPI0010AA8011|nr:HipA domain-containing protein [Rhodobacter xinxiangensis]